MPELLYIPMQGVQPPLPVGSSKNCPVGLRQHSSILVALNSGSIPVRQFNSPTLEPGVVKHLTCALPVGE